MEKKIKRIVNGHNDLKRLGVAIVIMTAGVLLLRTIVGLMNDDSSANLLASLLYVVPQVLAMGIPAIVVYHLVILTLERVPTFRRAGPQIAVGLALTIAVAVLVLLIDPDVVAATTPEQRLTRLDGFWIPFSIGAIIICSYQLARRLLHTRETGEKISPER